MRSTATTTLRFPLLMVLFGSAACSSTSTPGATTGGAPGATGGNASTAGSTTTAGTTSGGPAAGGNNTASGGTGVVGGAAGGLAGNSSSGGAGSSAGGASGSGNTGGTAADVCPTLPTAALAAADITQFNDDGGWCWYQDERVVVDVAAKKAIIGSVAIGSGRNGHQEAVIYDLTTKAKTKYTLQTGLNPDDHNAPAFVVLPSGKYAAMWATHRDNCNSYYSVFDGTAWAASKTYDWTGDGCAWDAASNPSPAHKVTYANPWYLSAEDKIYSSVRSVSTSPAMLVSGDGGGSWKFYGRLTASATVGYVAGYYKYWGNGVDRIDFVGTEAHPRDNDNSLWHGYYKGGKLYDSTDKVVDDTAGDTMAQDVSKFSKVFGTGTMLTGPTGMVTLHRMWNHDITRYADGSIAILGQGRADFPSTTPADSDPDKRIFYSRWDGKTWKTTYLVKAGPKLYPDEQDYTGLSALHPDNPHVIFVSSTFDPRTDMQVPSKKHEIFMGVTCDNGATWKWQPLTEGSTADNLRPVVPKWDSNHTLLVWEKGDYKTAQTYVTQIVGTTVLSATTP